jgi:putative aminopeptidase FrvX
MEKAISLPGLDQDYLIDVLVRLLNTPSPTGLAGPAVDLVEQELSALSPLRLSRTAKGALVALWPGASNDLPRALTAHVDTLGAMVREIKPGGRLQLTRIGGLVWNAVETEGCWVHTRGGERVRGSLLLNFASAHVHAQKVTETRRDDDSMEVRLDARV